MSQLLSILAFAFSFFVCSAIYTIVYRRRQKKAKEELAADKPMLDDTSYIQEVQHLSGQVGFVVWQQYDILLATQPYDWWTMVDWANYVEAEELDSLDSLRIGAPGQEETELVHVYNQNKGSRRDRTRPRLQPEQRGAEKLRQAERRIWFAEHCRT